nr:MAG: putative RNA-dependent RNA polymerase [Narnaviridae sp.]
MANQSKFDRDSSECEYSGAKAPAQELGNLVNKAPVLKVKQIARLLKSKRLSDDFGFAPLWDPKTIRSTYMEIKTLYERDGTLARPLDKLSIDCFFKAAYMTQWYTNTIRLWRASFDGLDYGTNAQRTFSSAIEGFLSQESLSRLVGRLWTYAKYGHMEKYLKWATATLWAEALQQSELPPKPDFVQVTKGESTLSEDRIWIKLCRDSKRGVLNNLGRKLMITFTKDIYMTKNSSLPVEEDFIEENIAKHKKILCTVHDTDPLSNRMDKLITTAIQQCADDIFGALPVQDDGIYKIKGKLRQLKVPCERQPPSRIPSLGASVDNGRHKGGAAGDLLANHCDTTDYTLPSPIRGFLHSYCSYKGRYTEVRTPYDPDLYIEAEKSSRSISFGRETVEAQVVPLLEAFKVRTITKGDADQYHLARRWQKVIHSHMRRQQNCRLIGQPCNSAYLSQIFGNSPLFTRKDGDGGFFVSGDYESATDLLHPYLSEFANEAICQRLRIPLEDQKVLKQCLTGHSLKYTSKGAYYKQEWGQLMGSPSSFPILCLINLAATKVAYEEYCRGIGSLGKNEFLVLSEIPMCVNGDDILFWAYNEAHYEIWKDVTKQCGLKFSLGKNYTHRNVAIINSQLFFYGGFNYKVGPAPVFYKTGHLHPQTLFYNAVTLNSRLISGGSRSEAVSGGGSGGAFQLVDYDQPFLEVLGEQLTEGKRTPLSYFDIELNSQDRQKYDTMNMDERLRFLRDGYPKYKPDEKKVEYDGYVKWRSTIEARCEKLFEMFAGDQEIGRTRPAMREALEVSFNSIQHARIKHFTRWGFCDVDNRTPYYIPQSLGGLGFIPPRDHKFTILEYLEVATLEGCPRGAEQWIKTITPRLPLPTFLKAVRSELESHQDILGIKRELRSTESLGLDRFFGEEDSFWEHSFLTGFIKADNMIVGVDDVGTEMMFSRNNPREFKRADLTRTKKALFKQGELLGMMKKETVEGGKKRIVAVEGETCFEKIDFSSIDLYKTHRPLPEYE